MHSRPARNEFRQSHRATACASSLAVGRQKLAGSPPERELRTTPALSEASYLSYVIKLVALTPYPRSTQQIRPEDYVATLTVERP